MMGDFKPKSKFSKFLSGKGFYLALGVCLVGTAAAAWTAISSTQQQVEEKNSNVLYSSRSSSSSSTSRPEWAFTSSGEDDATVGKSQSGEPVQSSSSSSAAVSSSAASSSSSSQPESSSQQSEPQKQQTLVFSLPMVGEVSTPYSGGELVKNMTLGEWRTHDGVDILAAEGTPVQAVADGLVTKISKDPMWGTVVEITHQDTLVSVYCGLEEELAVKAGDKVQMEQEIGKVGEIPGEISLESHLHFGMKQDGNWIDPLEMIASNAQQ